MATTILMSIGLAIGWTVVMIAGWIRRRVFEAP
jgi:hypothetical protein